MSWLTSNSANGGKEDMGNMVTLFNGSGKILPLLVQAPDGSRQEIAAPLQPKAIFAIPQESCGLEPYAHYIAKGNLVQVQPGQPVPAAPAVRGEYPGAVVTPRTPDFAGPSVDSPNMPVVSAFGAESMDYTPPAPGQPSAPLINQASVNAAAAALPPAQPVATASASPGAAMVAAGAGTRDAGSVIPTAQGRRGRPPNPNSKKAKAAAKKAAAQAPVAAQPVAPQPLAVPTAAPELAQPPIAQALPQPVQANNVPINPLTGKPMWVQVGPLLPKNEHGYIIKPDPSGIPGRALAIPMDSLEEHSPEMRAALANATNQILHEATSGGNTDPMAVYDRMSPEDRLQFITNANDLATMNKVVAREPDGKLSLMAQQKARQIYDAQYQPVQPVAAQPVASVMAAAPVAQVAPTAPSVPVMVGQPAPVAAGQPAAPVMVRPGGQQ